MKFVRKKEVTISRGRFEDSLEIFPEWTNKSVDHTRRSWKARSYLSPLERRTMVSVDRKRATCLPRAASRLRCTLSRGTLVCIHRMDISFFPLVFLLFDREHLVLFNGENASVSSRLRVKTVLHRGMEIVDRNDCACN